MVVAALALASASGGEAATSGSVVGAEVPGATYLDTIGCPPADPTRTSLGNVTAGASVVTAADCDVQFGSSNTTATLRTYRSSPRAAAMAAESTVMTDNQGSGRVLDMDMVDASNGWAAISEDAARRVVSTSDGGITWPTHAAASAAVSGSARAVSAPNTSDVWIARYANAAIVRSGNGGTSWTGYTLPGTNARGTDIWAADATTAWVVGSINDGTTKARLWRTTNGGTSWTVQMTEADTTSQFTAVDFAPGTTRGYALTQGGEIFSTSDGVTWTLQLTTGNSLVGVDAYDATHALVVGSHGQVRQTSNAGTTWINRDVADGIPLRDVSYRSSGVAWASGDLGIILRSTNDGTTWSTVRSRVEPGIVNAIETLSDTAVVTGTYGESFARTTDTGASWTRSATPAPGTNWASIDGVDGASVWRVGSAGAIAHSTNSTTWSPQASGTTEALYGVEALDRTEAIAVGSNGTIRRTTNGGTTWSAVASATTETLRAVTSTRAGHVWIAGDSGTILRSTNRGASFSAVASATTARLLSVAALDELTVLVGTGAGSIRRTQDGGATWATVGSPGSIAAVAGLSAVPGTNVVWAAQGMLRGRSTDAGTTWTTSGGASGSFFNDIDAVDSNSAYAVGRYGEVVVTKNAASSWQEVTGFSGTRTATSVLALGPDDAVVVSEANSEGRVVAGAGAPDYGDAGASWAGAAGHFGICLRAAPGTTATWPTTGSCPTSDGTNWRGLPDHGGTTEAPTASTSAAGLVTASFRFGMKVPVALPAGAYRAPVSFEVVAPAT